MSDMNNRAKERTRDLRLMKHPSTYTRQKMSLESHDGAILLGWMRGHQEGIEEAMQYLREHDAVIAENYRLAMIQKYPLFEGFSKAWAGP